MKCKLTGGNHLVRDSDGNLSEVEVGAEVELTDEQYAQWSDKFEKVEGDAAPTPSPTPPRRGRPTISLDDE